METMFRDVKQRICNLTKDDVFMQETLLGNSDKKYSLLIIPGFSDDSYNRNKSTLLDWYDSKLNKELFKELIFIKFKPEVRTLAQQVFKGGTVEGTVK
jgi:hypothetical protein